MITYMMKGKQRNDEIGERKTEKERPGDLHGAGVGKSEPKWRHARLHCSKTPKTGRDHGDFATKRRRLHLFKQATSRTMKTVTVDYNRLLITLLEHSVTLQTARLVGQFTVVPPRRVLLRQFPLVFVSNGRIEEGFFSSVLP